MTTLLSPKDALATIPGWEERSVDISEFPGGLSNRTFRIDSEGESFTLRLDAEQTANFMVNRDVELELLLHAADRNLFPQVVYSNPIDSILLTNFVPGRVWEPEDTSKTDNLDMLAVLLRRVHALPLTGVTFDANAVVERYAENLTDEPASYDFAVYCKDVIVRLPLPENLACCHNDVVAGNIIATPELLLLDWEYACDNDPLFDLASFIAFHDLHDEHARYLLQSYAQSSDVGLFERLQTQMRIYDVIQWLWYACLQRVRPNSDVEQRMQQIRKRIN